MNKAIDELEEFLLCDLPSKIFPLNEDFVKLKGERWLREDAFENKEDVEKYITSHFKILRDKLGRLK